MPLTVGEKAPPFVLPASTGQHISLQALAGKMVLLYFYPRDDTPGCTKEACGFREHYTALTAAGIEVLGVSADSLRAHTKFTEKYHLPFPLLSDAEKTVATAYGAWGEKKSRGRSVVGMKRMTFLIDASGTIQRIWSTVKPEGHAAEVLEHARKVHIMTTPQTASTSSATLQKQAIDFYFDPSCPWAWRTEAAAEPGIEERILAEHQDGVDRLGAFGVPTISISGQRGFFGPVITSVPTGEDAGELWDHISWLSGRGDFFEYKRSRK